MVCDFHGTAGVSIIKFPNLKGTHEDHRVLGWAASFSLQISRGSCRLHSCLTWVPSMDVSAFRSRKNLVAVEGRHLAVLELAGVSF